MKLSVAKSIVHQILNHVQREAIKGAEYVSALEEKDVSDKDRVKILAAYKKDVEAISIIKNKYLIL